MKNSAAFKITWTQIESRTHELYSQRSNEMGRTHLEHLMCFYIATVKTLLNKQK